MPKKKGKKGGKNKGKKKDDVQQLTVEEFRGALNDEFKASGVSEEERKVFLSFIDEEMERERQDSDPLNFCLPGNDLTPLGIKTFCDTLTKKKEVFKLVRVICISHAKIGAEGTKALATCIKTLESLSRVELIGCQIPPHVCGELGASINSSSGLRKLNLSYNKLGTDGLQNLVESLNSNKMVELKLSYCGLNDSAKCGELLSKLVKSCQSLKILDLAGNRLGARGLHYTCRAILDSGSGLESLKFCLNGVGEGDQSDTNLEMGMDTLVEVLEKSSLNELDMNGNCLPEEFAESLLAALEVGQSRGKVSKFSAPSHWNKEISKKFTAKFTAGKAKKKKKKGKAKKKK